MKKFLGFINTKLDIIASIVSVLLIISMASFIHFIEPPETFPSRIIIGIEEGETLSEIANDFEEKGLIQSSEAFKTFVILLHSEKVVAGDYFFEGPLTVLTLAERVANGVYGLNPERVTIPEGLTNNQIAEIFSLRLGDSFDTEGFLELADGKEGYLFPDTYFFLQNVKPEEVIETMEETFEERISELENEIDSFGRPLDEVIVMASILEEEARHYEDRQKISGILWKRVEIDMPLQVDAAFQKVEEAEGRNTYQLTKADLRAESPFNTYVNKGLPPAPITNPSFEAIKAAVLPIDSEYLFYVSDRRGNLYFAEDYDDHQENVWNYLNS